MFTFKDYIYEIDREKSFTGAANKLFMTQPALSICVKKTEEKLGAEIFDRKSSPIRLTECGRAYINAVEQIYAIENDLKNKVNDIGNLNTGSLSICAANVVFTYILPQLWETFSQKYPKIDLKLTESFSEDLKNRALNGFIDLIVDYDFNHTLFEIYPIKEEKIFLSLSKYSPLAKKFINNIITRDDILENKSNNKPSINIYSLKDEEFIIMKKKNDMHRRASKIFAEVEMRPKIKLELDQLKTCYELSCQGLGISFVTDTLIKNANNENGVYLNLSSQSAKRKLCIAHKKNTYVTSAMKKFIEMAIDMLN